MSGTIRFRPTQRDYLAANRAWFRRTLLRRRYFGAIALGAGAVAAIGAWITWDDPDTGLRWSITLGMVFGFIGFMLAMAVVSWLLQPFTVRKLFRQHRALDREFEVAWDERGITYRYDEDSVSRTPWHDYHGWCDGRDVLLLLFNDRLFQFLPHRAMTPAQLADLRAGAARGRDCSAATHRLGAAR